MLSLVLAVRSLTSGLFIIHNIDNFLGNLANLY